MEEKERSSLRLPIFCNANSFLVGDDDDDDAWTIGSLLQSSWSFTWACSNDGDSHAFCISYENRSSYQFSLCAACFAYLTKAWEHRYGWWETRGGVICLLRDGCRYLLFVYVSFCVVYAFSLYVKYLSRILLIGWGRHGKKKDKAGGCFTIHLWVAHAHDVEPV